MTDKLREALRLLVDATAYLKNRHTVVTADLLHARSQAIGALLAEPDVCTWELASDILRPTYQCVCDGRFRPLPMSEDLGPSEKADTLCPGCGGKIEVKE